MRESAVEEKECELIVIGTGMAGNAAALFAANRGVDTLQVGRTSSIHFASGLMDLMAVHPVGSGKLWENPWKAIDAVIRDNPRHPYARTGRETIEAALEELVEFLTEKGIRYHREKEKNSKIITSLGTIKPTYYLPETMKNASRAMKEKAPVLFVDFKGMKEYSARQIKETLGGVWPGLSAKRVAFPGMDNPGELYNEPPARSLDLERWREELAAIIRPLLGNAQYVGFPAMLGMYRADEVIIDLGKKIGVPVFEIPTLPVSVPGLRIKEAFESGLKERGVGILSQRKVLKVSHDGRGFILEIGRGETETVVKSRGVVLASGRFLGKGLFADRKGIMETIFDLPVTFPLQRSKWHGENLFDKGGHPVNRSGIEVDNMFRPLDRSGNPAFPGLHAAGSILGHQDWMRMKCGSGTAVATAHAAVTGFLECR